MDKTSFGSRRLGHSRGQRSRGSFLWSWCPDASESRANQRDRKRIPDSSCVDQRQSQRTCDEVDGLDTKYRCHSGRRLIDRPSKRSWDGKMLYTIDETTVCEHHKWCQFLPRLNTSNQRSKTTTAFLGSSGSCRPHRRYGGIQRGKHSSRLFQTSWHQWKCIGRYWQEIIRTSWQSCGLGSDRETLWSRTDDSSRLEVV